MALTAAKGVNVGAYHAQIAFRDSNGYPQGVNTTPDTLTPDTTNNMYYIQGLMDFTPEVPSTGSQTNFGGNSIISKTAVGVTDLGNATFQLSQFDETLDAYLRKTSVDVATIDGWAISPDNVGQTDIPRFVFIASARFTNSVDGSDEWMNYVYPNCQITTSQEAAMSQVDGDVTNPNPLQYTLTPSRSTRFPGISK
jgi:hypothetical protein